MDTIKTVTTTFGSDFAIRVQELLNHGYKLNSSNCGIITHPDNSTDTLYQAILLKEE